MDEGYENDEGGAAIVSGAISVSSEFNKRHDHIRAVMFQRDNILRSVQNSILIIQGILKGRLLRSIGTHINSRI